MADLCGKARTCSRKMPVTDMISSMTGLGGPGGGSGGDGGSGGGGGPCTTTHVSRGLRLEPLGGKMRVHTRLGYASSCCSSSALLPPGGAGSAGAGGSVLCAVRTVANARTVRTRATVPVQSRYVHTLDWSFTVQAAGRETEPTEAVDIVPEESPARGCPPSLAGHQPCKTIV